MIEKCYWEEGSKQQWTFYANDNSSLDSLSEKLIIDDVLCSSDEKIENLGIKRVNGKIYSGNYVGVCRLKSLNGKNITSTDGREVILKIEPRFPVSVVDMLNALRDDNEFERYLAPQTNRINEAYREIEDLKDNELFHFFENEDPIFLKQMIIIPFYSEKSSDVHYDFMFAWPKKDDMYGFEKIFYSYDEPFGTLDGHAKRLYEEAKEHFFDVPVANDIRKFIAGYLGKGGDA